MKCTGVSPSSYATHTDCALKWFIDQRLKYRFPSKWKNTDIGTICHHILEVLALIKLSKQEKKSYIEDEVFGKMEIPATINIDSLCEESYAHFINIFKQHTWGPKDLKDIKKMVHDVVDSDFNPLESEIVAVEKWFEIPFEEEWAKQEDGTYFVVRGFIDLIRRVDGGLEVEDYKSGKKKDFATGKDKEYADFEKDIQLLVYYMAARILYPNEDMYLVTINYLRHGGAYTICFDDKDVEKIKKLIKKKYEDIKATKIPRKNKTWKCAKFCDYSANSFPNPTIEFRSGKFQPVGSPMSMCDEAEFTIKKYGLDWVEKTYKKPEEPKIVEATPAD